MILPELAAGTDAALLLLRLLVAAVFASSGRSHALQPGERAESIGLPPAATRLLGVAELAGAVMLALGIWVQLAALLLIAIMAGALCKKVFVWEKGFWGEEGDGWFYELLYIACNLVFLTTGGGGLVLV